MSFDFPTSRKLLERARAVIPGGIYGHYAALAREGFPVFFERAEGAHFWDVDGNEFIDYMCGHGPMIVGYGNPAVEAATRRQADIGNTVTIASPLLVELAERLVDRIAGAEWALFGKNGADVTNLAVMVARAATGRSKVVTVRGGYHGTAPWMQAPGSAGTLPEDHDAVLQIDWNRPDQFEALVAAHPGEIACFLSSPYHHPILEDNALPSGEFWPRIRKQCDDAGIVLAVDDVRAGFRLHPWGSAAAFGFEPDLACFGKALANGHPISALVGRDSLREPASEVFFTGTQFFNAIPMAAAIATLDELERTNAVAHTNALGQRLCEGLIRVAKEHGTELRASGSPAMPYFRLVDGESAGPTRRHFRWTAECVRRGVYLTGHHNHFLSTAHSEADLERSFEVAGQAFEALGRPRGE